MKRLNKSPSMPIYLFVCAALLFAPMILQASEQAAPQIQVNGHGQISLAPDTAMLSLTVMREAATAKEALAENSRAMNAVLQTMRDQGIDERDLQTSGFSIQPRYHYPEQPERAKKSPTIAAYKVTNTLNLSVRELDKVGEILDRSVQLGVNQGGHIRFTNDDPSAAIAQARSAAVQDALQRARTVAEAAQVKLGNILEISENTAQAAARPMMMRSARAMADEAGSVPIASGENSYSVQVTLRVAIEQ